MKPDRDPVASDQIHLVTVFGLCVSERVDRGVGRHPQPSRLKISNYFCLGTYYFLPANIDPERLKSTGVAFTEFKNTVAALAGKVLFFLDTCHSGNVMQQEKRRAVLDIAGVI